jgi:hypothetical protein
VFDQRPHPVVDSIEKPADQPGIEVLLEPEIESSASSGSRPTSCAMSAIERLPSPCSGFTGAPR